MLDLEMTQNRCIVYVEIVQNITICTESVAVSDSIVVIF